MFLTASPRAATVYNTPMTVKPVMVTSQPYRSTCHRHVILQCNWTCDHLNTIPNLNVGHHHFHFRANMQLLMSQRGLTHIHLTLTSPPWQLTTLEFTSQPTMPDNTTDGVLLQRHFIESAKCIDVSCFVTKMSLRQPVMLDNTADNDDIPLPSTAPVIWRTIWCQSPDRKLPKQKAQQKHRISDRLIPCWLCYQTGHLKKP